MPRLSTARAEKLEGFCWEFGNLWPVIQALHRPLGEVALTVANTERLDCAFEATLAVAPAAGSGPPR